MKVIAMRRVVVGAEDAVEELAGGGSCLVQKFTAFVPSPPVRQYTNSGAVGEYEAGDVEGFGGGMLAAHCIGSAVDVAAGVAAEMFDTDHRLSERALRRRPQSMAFPQGKRDGCPTAQ